MTGSYRGMSGVSCTGFDQWAGYYTEVQVLLRQCPRNRGLLHTDGAATNLNPERMANITDGTSTTFMIGERTTKTHQTRGTFWADAFNLYSLSGVYAGNAASSASLLNDYDLCSRQVSDVAQCKYGWGSFHPGAINFVMADGSIRTVPISINMNVFAAMATIAGGETLQTDF